MGIAHKVRSQTGGLKAFCSRRSISAGAPACQRGIHFSESLPYRGGIGAQALVPVRSVIAGSLDLFHVEGGKARARDNETPGTGVHTPQLTTAP